MCNEKEERIARFLKVYEYLNPRNVRTFCNNVGAPQSTVMNYLNGSRMPTAEFIIKVCKAYPEINIDWILEDKGEMLVAPESAAVTTVPTSEMTTPEQVIAPDPDKKPSLYDNLLKVLLEQIDQLKTKCASQEEEIARLKGLFGVD